MINIFQPNTEQLARGTAVHLAVRFGMQTGKPFEASEHISNEGEPTLSELRELEGQTWLTTLKITHGAKSFTFEECLISINMEKNIVTTALQGRNGTIKEYISDGDYNITVDAGVSTYQVQNEENEIDISYPIDTVKELQELLALPEALEVQSDFLDIFGIDSTVVKSFSLQQETHSNRQSINIQMLSDRAYEIKLKEENDVKVV
ncbi:DUF6046 domain-containing protein [Bergeyella zoohelcum]|uniref:DUF6046 domain-containing protein n=1 Tax=Bergeyella zoohelcum TaxID=1015 RepID=A0A7Z8YR28_9FLAO|nr:DUF6046 domain-containing protein [Bergeyella zoohelcum]VDH05784.1 Uncharacterised protein [Bergeyella zoohelcum]